MIIMQNAKRVDWKATILSLSFRNDKYIVCIVYY